MAQISDPCHILGNNLIIRMNVFKAQHEQKEHSNNTSPDTVSQM